MSRTERGVSSGAILFAYMNFINANDTLNNWLQIRRLTTELKDHLIIIEKRLKYPLETLRMSIHNFHGESNQIIIFFWATVNGIAVLTQYGNSI